MRPPRGLLVVPPAFAALFVAIGLAVGAAPLAVVLRAENELGKLVALAGCVVGALAFERGDYLRRAWMLSGGCMLLLLVRDVTVVPAVDAVVGGVRFDAARGALVVAANTSSVIGAWMLAHAWSVSGLDDDDSRRGRWPLVAVGVVASLVATGWPLLHDLRLLFGGDMNAIAWVGSDLGDTICLALVAPVLATALALRGGRLLWPWALLTAGGIAWVLYDAGWGTTELLHVDGLPPVRLGVEALRALACTLTGMAGVAQRWAVAES